MKIYRLEFKNINSYGNNLQVLEFDDKGGLILLCGDNGTGKSTIKQSIELCLFGKVQGKSGKRLALTKLPNRRNGNLYTGVYFKNHLGQDIVIKRYIQPNNFEMFVDEEPFAERFKIMSEKEREKIIGFNFEVFKSFISLNMNDFKNFISLSKEDKENLLNKLFNISDLDTLYSITKDLDISNQKMIHEIENEIHLNEQSILDYKKTIQNIKQTQQKSKNEKLAELKQIILSKQPIYNQYNEEIKDLEKQKNENNKKLNKLNKIREDKQKEKTKLEIEIETIKEKIKIFETGICPICNTDLKGKQESHLKELNDEIELKKEEMKKCNKFLEKCVLEDAKIRNAIDTIYNQKLEVQNKLLELKTELSLLNKEYKLLKEQNQENLAEELEIKVKHLIEINNQKQKLLESLNKKSKIYDELKKIFSIDGIRKSIIKNALIPINEYLKDYLKKLNSEYNAQLDENFDAKILELGILDIDPETLSKGEDKKINIAIALSYLNLILELKKSNIMFLDEIFDGVDVNNISLTLNVLRKIALKHKINIIIVNHGMEQIVDTSIFDKIIRTTKDIFSDIEIIK